MILIRVKKYISWYQTMQLINSTIKSTLNKWERAQLIERVKDCFFKEAKEAYICADEIKAQKAQRRAYVQLWLSTEEFTNWLQAMDKENCTNENKELARKFDFLKVSYCGEYQN